MPRPRGHRDFCRICGSVAPMLDEASGLVIAPAGNLEGDLGLRPTRHMFVGSKAPWYTITDDRPQHDEFPPEFGMRATPRAPVETRPGVAQGSCLCGDVAYEISTPPLRMFLCHCSRCRQGRSAAHCANVFYKAEGFRWTRGAEQVQDFPLPGAQYFGTAFCRHCGSALPRVSVERNLAVVPAGSLDSDPGIAPKGHTLGFPHPEVALKVVEAIAGAGADLIELGIPFSDPLANGPTIQRSTQVALEQGMTVARCLEMVQDLRGRGINQPLLLMGYINPILTYGTRQFVSQAVEVGVDGLIIPDLPPEEAGELEAACQERSLALVYLLAPTSTPERVTLAASHSTGFVYIVSVTGVTGARHDLRRAWKILSVECAT